MEGVSRESDELAYDDQIYITPMPWSDLFNASKAVGPWLALYASYYQYT